MRHLPHAAAVLALLVPMAAAAEWQLQLEDDFSRGAPLNTGFWMAETGFHRNREEQYYQPANVRVGNGALVIEGRRETVPNAAHRPGSRDWRTARSEARYTSGSIVSRGALHYGKVEVVARGPVGPGTWPAIWLSHESAAQYGEIDIHEAVGKHPDTAFAGVHWGRDARTRKHSNVGRQVHGYDGQWHTHTLEWTPERIEIRLDGEVLFRFDPAQAASGGIDPLRQPMRLRINLALGGNWGGPIAAAALPARLEVRSIRIWRLVPGAAAVPPAAQARQAPDGAGDATTLPANAGLPGAPVAPPAAPGQAGQGNGPRWGR